MQKTRRVYAAEFGAMPRSAPGRTRLRSTALTEARLGLTFFDTVGTAGNHDVEFDASVERSTVRAFAWSAACRGETVLAAAGCSYIERASVTVDGQPSFNLNITGVSLSIDGRFIGVLDG